MLLTVLYVAGFALVLTGLLVLVDLWTKRRLTTSGRTPDLPGGSTTAPAREVTP